MEKGGEVQNFLQFFSSECTNFLSCHILHNKYIIHNILHNKYSRKHTGLTRKYWNRGAYRVTHLYHVGWLQNCERLTFRTELAIFSASSALALASRASAAALPSASSAWRVLLLASAMVWVMAGIFFRASSAAVLLSFTRLSKSKSKPDSNHLLQKSLRMLLWPSYPGFATLTLEGWRANWGVGVCMLAAHPTTCLLTLNKALKQEGDF